MERKEKDRFLSQGYDFTNYARSLHGGGPRESSRSTAALDLSLANLFQKLTVECSGILGNPQWKHYRHMQLLKKDQIRLSNGIWRSWHIQFQKGRKPLFCKFVIDPDTDMKCHQSAQAVVIEGKYWKRTHQAVANEYRKWRLYYKQKNEWSALRRTANASVMFPQTTQQDNRHGDAPMQVDEAIKFANIFQSLDEFSESVFGFPRPGEDRSYMRPLIESSAMMQPNLEPLNPTLDDFLERLEPMEVIFPLFTGANNNRMQPSIANAYMTQSQTSPTQYGNQPPQYGNQPAQYGTQQYGNQPAQYGNQYLPRAGIPQGEQPYPNQISFQNGSGESFQLNPSDFLNIPQPQEVQMRPERGEVMDLGTTPIIGFNQSGSSPSMLYQQQTTTAATPLFPPMQTSSQTLMENPSLLTSYVPEIPSQSHPSLSPTPTTSTEAIYVYGAERYTPIPDSYPATPIQPQVYQSRKTSGDLTAPLVTSPIPDSAYNKDRRGSAPEGVVDPNVQIIAEQMRRLEEQQIEQLREIEKQQTMATSQYLQLLQQYLADSVNQPSEQQQRDLASVLSNPSSVQILKSILLQEKEMMPPTGDVRPPNVTIKQESISPQQSSTDLKSCSLDHLSQQILSFPQLPKDNNSQDFQTRLVMAAAAQGNTLPLTSSQHITTDKQIASPETEIPPALLKKFKNARNLTPNEKRVYQELRRQSHITAEQKRRGSIKNGFEHLQSLVINPSQYPSGKVSKTVLLEKTIEHLQQKHSERDVKEKRIEQLKSEIQQLNQSITSCQQQLPATGAPVTRQRLEENKQLYKDYVQQRTQQNYKFWIYSIILGQLFESYNNTVSTANADSFYQSILGWFDQHCNLPALRPIVMSSLRELSVKTSILSDPGKVPEQLTSYVATKEKT